MNDIIFNPGKKAMSEHYAGEVYISGLLRNTGYGISRLVFDAGIHNDWHIHPDASQVLLLILDGGLPRRRKTETVDKRRYHQASPM